MWKKQRYYYSKRRRQADKTFIQLGIDSDVYDAVDAEIDMLLDEDAGRYIFEMETGDSLWFDERPHYFDTLCESGDYDYDPLYWDSTEPAFLLDSSEWECYYE